MPKPKNLLKKAEEEQRHTVNRAELRQTSQTKEHYWVPLEEEGHAICRNDGMTAIRYDHIRYKIEDGKLIEKND